MQTLQQAIKRAEILDAPSYHGVTFDIADVYRFALGEKYVVVLRAPHRFNHTVELQCQDLDNILDIMHTEFNSTTLYAPELKIPNDAVSKHFLAIRPPGKRLPAYLMVTPVPKTERTVLGLPLDELIETVRQSVTLFNLTGTWTHVSRGNL